MRFGLHRPSVTGPIFVYRVCTCGNIWMPQFTPKCMRLTLHCLYFAWYVGGIFIVDDISNFIAEIALMGCDDIKISSQM